MSGEHFGEHERRNAGVQACVHDDGAAGLAWIRQEVFGLGEWQAGDAEESPATIGDDPFGHECWIGDGLEHQLRSRACLRDRVRVSNVHELKVGALLLPATCARHLEAGSRSALAQKLPRTP